MTRRLAILLAAVASATTIAYSSGEILVQRQAYLMGTRVELSVFAADRGEGVRRLETALASLEATDAALSTWKPASDVSAINRAPIGQRRTLAQPLCDLFAALGEWRTATRGAFDPAIGALIDAYSIHGDGRIPAHGQLALARAQSGWPLLEFDGHGCTLTRRDDVRLDVGAFGKGEALDRAGALLGPVPWMIDLGGQVSVGAPPPALRHWTVRVANPLDRSRSVMTVALRSGSLSTSAGSERDQYVDGVRVGHILDPRTGAPAPYDGAVVVWHERGLVADILSTALYVMGPVQGLQWAKARDIAAAFLIRDAGTVRVAATPAFGELEPAIELE